MIKEIREGAIAISGNHVLMMELNAVNASWRGSVLHFARAATRAREITSFAAEVSNQSSFALIINYFPNSSAGDGWKSSHDNARRIALAELAS